MKLFFTFTHTRIITTLLTLCAICAIGIFGIAGTGFAHAHNTQNPPIKQSTRPPLPPSASCGVVNARGGEPPVVFNGQAAANAEICFWRTYQQCQAKTLIFHQMGVDTGSDDTLWTIKRNSMCYIANLVQYYSVSVPLRNHSSFINCMKMRKTQKGLLLSDCGKNDDFIIPAPTSTP
jgi:hypothetical protein